MTVCRRIAAGTQKGQRGEESGGWGRSRVGKGRGFLTEPLRKFPACRMAMLMARRKQVRGREPVKAERKIKGRFAYSRKEGPGQPAWRKKRTSIVGRGGKPKGVRPCEWAKNTPQCKMQKGVQEAVRRTLGDGGLLRPRKSNRKRDAHQNTVPRHGQGEDWSGKGTCSASPSRRHARRGKKKEKD